MSLRLENIIPISSATSFVKFVRLTQVNLTQGISGGNLIYNNQNIRHLKGWESKLRTDTQHFYGTYRHYIFIYSSDFWKKKKVILNCYLDLWQTSVIQKINSQWSGIPMLLTGQCVPWPSQNHTLSNCKRKEKTVVKTQYITHAYFTMLSSFLFSSTSFK